MNTRSLPVAFGLALLAGCSAGPARTGTPTDHPAHPMAAEAPAPRPSQTLQDRAVASPDSQGSARRDAAPVVYTCPHHPEVTSNEPGVCPKCDMELQPQQADAGHGGHQ